MLIETLIIQQASRATSYLRPTGEEGPRSEAWVGFWVVLGTMISLAAVIVIVLAVAA